MRGHFAYGFFGRIPPHCGHNSGSECEPFEHHDHFGHRGPYGHHGHGPFGHHGHGPFGHHGHGPFGHHSHGPFGHHGHGHFGHHGPYGPQGPHHGPFGHGTFGPGHHEHFGHCRPKPYGRPEREGRCHFSLDCDKYEGRKNGGRGRSPPPPCCGNDSGCERRSRSRSRGRKSRPCCPRNRDCNPEAENSCNEVTENVGRRCPGERTRPCHSV